MCTNKTNTTFVDYRTDLLKSIEYTHNKLVEAVNMFNSPIATKPINREDLDSFPLMEWIDIGGGILIRKRKNRFSHYLNFDTKMSKGSEFGEHFHEDIIESCEVIEGELYDTSTNEFYRKGDVAHYDKGIRHTPRATEETLLHVLFKP